MAFKKIVAANWKMNKTVTEAEDYFGKLKSKFNHNENCEIIIFPPFTLLEYVTKECKSLGIVTGGQNCHFESKGAFTGEISAGMLGGIGAEYVILGHSERRKYFFESDEIINKKLRSALQCGLKVILCVGESLEVRQSGNVREFIGGQLQKDLFGISEGELSLVTVAYEPVWAIGSGLTITFDEADKIGRFIKNFVSEGFGCDISVLYGGSVNSDNAGEFLSLENINGVLVGGASLSAESFIKITNAV